MQAIKFKELTKHGALQFLPGVAVAFEDADAAPYFVACGWADNTTDAPVHTYGAGEVVVDPLTRQNETGLLISDLIQQAAAPTV